MYSVPQIAEWSAESLDKAAKELLDACSAESATVHDESEWKQFRDRWLARKNGILTQINEQWLKGAPKESKRDVGAVINRVKPVVEETVDARRVFGIVEIAAGGFSESESQGGPQVAKVLANNSRRALLAAERIDLTLPGLRRPLGAEHPVLKTMEHIVSVFKALGYSVGEGPEIETDYYNFEALNFPPNHPARDTQDTIFIAGQEAKAQRERLLLRTHTSPVQIRTMEKQKPPVRIVIPGKVHRNDEADATHSPMFHQVEGLAVDQGITFCDLKGTLDHAMKMFFGSKTRTRFQPSFFPFTEPSAEVAVTCFKCGGSGALEASTPCRLCKTSGWIELLGCGMVDPAVYGFVGYDAGAVSGFAFGMGVERIAMAMYDLDDIQLFYSGDVRFLQQFV